MILFFDHGPILDFFQTFVSFSTIFFNVFYRHLKYLTTNYGRFEGTSIKAHPSHDEIERTQSPFTFFSHLKLQF